MENGKIGRYQAIRTLEPLKHCRKIWHGWLRRRYHPASRNSNRSPFAEVAACRLMGEVSHSCVFSFFRDPSERALLRGLGICRPVITYLRMENLSALRAALAAPRDDVIDRTALRPLAKLLWTVMFQVILTFISKCTFCADAFRDLQQYSSTLSSKVRSLVSAILTFINANETAVIFHAFAQKLFCARTRLHQNYDIRLSRGLLPRAMLSVCLSVCLTVCLSTCLAQASIGPKQWNVGP